MNISCLIKKYFSFKGKIDFRTFVTTVLKIVLFLILINIIMLLPCLLPVLYMMCITGSSGEDIERFSDSIDATNYLSIMGYIEAILICLAIVSALSLIVRFIRNTTKK